VKSMVAFPQILSMMDERLDWTQRLGDAFLDQESAVMDTVQDLRQRAYAAGNLNSNEQVRVQRQHRIIVVEPAHPQVVYVPYYDPTVIYGAWWWPAPPVYWRPWAGYAPHPGVRAGFYWGGGSRVSVNFFFGHFDWPRRNVNVVRVNNYYYTRTVIVGRPDRRADDTHRGPDRWRHDPAHRRAVPYRDPGVRQQFVAAQQRQAAGHPGDPRGQRPTALPSPAADSRGERNDQRNDQRDHTGDGRNDRDNERRHQRRSDPEDARGVQRRADANDRPGGSGNDGRRSAAAATATNPATQPAARISTPAAPAAPAAPQAQQQQQERQARQQDRGQRASPGQPEERRAQRREDGRDENRRDLRGDGRGDTRGDSRGDHRSDNRRDSGRADRGTGARSDAGQRIERPTPPAQPTTQLQAQPERPQARTHERPQAAAPAARPAPAEQRNQPRAEQARPARSEARNEARNERHGGNGGQSQGRQGREGPRASPG